jgi:hypothetical protein
MTAPHRRPLTIGDADVLGPGSWRHRIGLPPRRRARRIFAKASGWPGSSCRTRPVASPERAGVIACGSSPVLPRDLTGSEKRPVMTYKCSFLRTRVLERLVCRRAATWSAISAIVAGWR